MEEIIRLLEQSNEKVFEYDGVTICVVENAEEGKKVGAKILKEIVDYKTVLYLSGGKTPKELYADLANGEVLRPGAVGLVDERYGERFHDTSNEKMLNDSGFLRFLEMLAIPFYPMLQDGLTRVETAENYDGKFRELNNTYAKSVATLGIGLDGHTAGIAGNREDSSTGSKQAFHNPMFSGTQRSLLVSEYDDPKGMFKERVSMTFLGLSMLDILLVLVFGEDKKEALKKTFSKGSEEEIPARFLKRPDIAKKTILITDQNVLGHRA